MGKELQFPTKTVRDWRLIEGAIANVLREARASDEMTAQVTAHMKEHCSALNRQVSIDMSLPFPGSTSAPEPQAIVDAIQSGVNKLESEMQAQTNTALLQLLATEVRLYIAQHGHP